MADINEIYKGSCFDLFKDIADESVDLVVTDPPYKLTARGNSGTMGGHYANEKTLKGIVFENNDIEIEDYLDELYRVLKDGTHCYIMTNNFNLCHFLEVISKSKFHFVKNLIWNKENKICGTYYMGQYEYIIFLRKGKDRHINNCGCSDILTFPNKKIKMDDGSNLHDSEKPIDLFKTLIENSSNEGDLVLDPFMGSGTTAVASLLSGRNFIGSEIDEIYHKRACDRIEETIMSMSENNSLF